MRIHWLNYQPQHRELLIFFGGWGTDPYPFAPLAVGERNVLMAYAYQPWSTGLDLSPLFARYERVHLLAWSMGVRMAAELLQPYAGQLATATAVNGTLQPVDDRYGIPEAIFRGTLQGFSERSLQKFARRMCGSQLPHYQLHAPQRPWQEQGTELEVLKQLVAGPAPANLFTKALVGQDDLIMPAANQQAFWAQHPQVTLKELPLPHFPFAAWSSWDEILSI